MATEKDFELEIRLLVTGFGKQQHWLTLGKEVKKVLAQRIGACSVEATRVRLVLDAESGAVGQWYDAQIGLIPDFDYEAG